MSLEPLIDCVDDVWVYEPLVVPYRNHAVVDNPFALTVPFNVADVSVTFVAEPVETFGTFPLLDLYVTVIVAVAVLPPLSLAVTVIVVSPFDKLMLEIVQLVVPIAVPLPPALLLHVTLLIPLALSEALPPRLIVLVVAV